MSHRAERITSILADDLGNAFWENYRRILIEYFSDSRLLLRAKSVADSGVWLSQIWKDQQASEDFRREALNGIDTFELLRQRGISSVESSCWIQFKEAKEKVIEISQRPHLFQLVKDIFNTEGMILGDPLKEGRNYLPFPELGPGHE